MFLFCELTNRFEYCASYQTRKDILTILVPWFYNLELVDINVTTDGLNNNLKISPSPIRSHATAKGTELILNNLFYLTCKFGDQYPDELELLWAILASTWRSNLRIICRYLMIIISLATFEMLAHGKRIICYLARVSQDRCIDELIGELERANESFGSLVDKDENHLPFYRYNQIPGEFHQARFDPMENNYNLDSDDLDEEDEDEDEDSINPLDQSNLTNEDNLEMLSDTEGNDLVGSSCASESDSDDYESDSCSDGDDSRTHLHFDDEDDVEHSINSDESDSLITKTRRFKYSVTRVRKSSMKKTIGENDG